MNNYFDPLNTNPAITACRTLTGGRLDNLSEGSQAEKFGQWLRDAREKAKLTKAELARGAKIARSYVTNLEGAVKNVLTAKPTLPKVEIVDRIAQALGVDPAEARRAAGYAPAQREASIHDIELERVSFYFSGLPRECQLDVLATIEALWRRRRAEGRAERAGQKGSGKHRPETVKPGVERKGGKRKAG